MLHKRTVTNEHLSTGGALILTGLFKKVVIADVLSPDVEPFFATPHAFSSLLLLKGLYYFSLQIYCDFSGYTDIARGVSRLLGIELPENFNQPYLSRNITEFWRRWHISLSTWLRDYLYIPLGGNRGGRLRTYINLLIVMGLGGLWHGAGISYLVWGLGHGALLAVARPFLGRLQSIDFVGFRIARMTLVFVCVSLLWIFFKLPDFHHAWSYLTGMFTPTANPNPTKLFYNLALIYSLPVIVQHFVDLRSLIERRLPAL